MDDQSLSKRRILRMRSSLASFRQWLSDDWHGEKYFACGLLLLLLTLLPTIFYYVDYPRVELNADTSAYLHVVDRLRAQPYLLVDTWRLPGYPILIMLVCMLAGRDNLMAVSVVQAALFVLTTLEIYMLAILLFRRAWPALFIGLLVGTNLVLLSYVKPIMAEGLAMCELTTLALATVYFLRSEWGFRYVVLSLLLLVFTRPEWVYLAPLLFTYLLLMTARTGMLWRICKKVLIASAILYSLVGIYIGINGLVNHYFGLTAIENFNWMGKVLQYNMWHEVTPENRHISQQISHYVATIDKDPYHVLPHVPELAQDNDSPAGSFARGIILHHVGEFLFKSVPYAFTSLTSYFDVSRTNIPGPYDAPLDWLKALDRWLYNMYILFPVCALSWLLALSWPRLRKRQDVAVMGVLALLGLYAIGITTMGGYRLDDYMRVHTVFNPLLTVVIWGSILLVSNIMVRKIGGALSLSRKQRRALNTLTFHG